MWMSCDSIDGKVARLRGLCSPFGEFLDHGGDTFAVMMSSVVLACILGVTDTPLGTVAWILCDMVGYYFSEPYTIYVCGQSKIERYFPDVILSILGMQYAHETILVLVHDPILYVLHETLADKWPILIISGTM